MFYKIRWRSLSTAGKVYGRSKTPWAVDELYVVFDALSDDDLIKIKLCYIVTEKLLKSFRESYLSGLGICRKIEPRLSGGLEEFIEKDKLPAYYLLKVVGVPGEDDLGVNKAGELIISEKVYQLLKGMTLKHLAIDEVKVIKLFKELRKDI
jgi:hypothetical protein